MKAELEQKLVKKYPNLFKNYAGNPMHTCMAWGCCHGDGWYDILDNLCDKLSKFDDIVLAQVKEKFGMLNVYIDRYPEDAYDEVCKIIEDAEAKSLITCEICGADGKKRNLSWVKVLCDNCLK